MMCGGRDTAAHMVVQGHFDFGTSFGVMERLRTTVVTLLKTLSVNGIRLLLTLFVAFGLRSSA